MSLVASPIRPLDQPIEDWGLANSVFTDSAFIPIEHIRNYWEYPFYQLLPPEKDRARLGYVFEPHAVPYLGWFYGKWRLPDGRFAMWNTWMSQLTVYPKGNHNG